jgi:hypothetical protein
MTVMCPARWSLLIFLEFLQLGVKLNDTGDIVLVAAAESMETQSDAVKLEIKNDLGNDLYNSGLGHGKRKCTQNTLYNTKLFW